MEIALIHYGNSFRETGKKNFKNQSTIVMDNWNLDEIFFIFDSKYNIVNIYWTHLFFSKEWQLMLNLHLLFLTLFSHVCEVHDFGTYQVYCVVPPKI